MQLELLWQLQQLDLSLAAVSGELEKTPLIEEVAETGKRYELARDEQDAESGRLKDMQKRSKSLELDLQKISAKREELRKKMYGGEVSNVRELEQMEKKLNSLEKEQSDIEEEILAGMESIEELEALLSKAAGNIRRVEQELQAKENELNLKTGELKDELRRLETERELLAAKIEPRYLERYDILARRHNGRALARVINDICEGCSVFISSAQRGFLYDSEAMVYCESCGRLLVRLAVEEGVEE